MDDLLKPVKTVKRVQSNIEKFETLSMKDSRTTLPKRVKAKEAIPTISETSVLKIEPPKQESNSLIEITPGQTGQVTGHKRHKRHDSTAFLQQVYLQKSAPQSLPDDARAILKSQPESEDLVAVLQYLQYGIEAKHDFNVRIASAKAAQIVNVLVTVTVPDQWGHLNNSKMSKQDIRMRDILLSCLTSVTGLGALLAQIRKLSIPTSSQDGHIMLMDEICVLSRVLNPHDILSTLLNDAITLCEQSLRRRALWQELSSILAGSKILSTVAQALSKVKSLDMGDDECSWLGDGGKYSAWLARRISSAAIGFHATDAESWSMLTQVTRRGLSLGHRDLFVSEIYTSLLMGKKALWTTLQLVLQNMSRPEQISFFDAMLRDLTRKYLLPSTGGNGILGYSVENQASISGVAAIVKGVVTGNAYLEDHLIEWLTATKGEHAALGLDTRRAVIATLALHEEKLQVILNKCLEEFSDKVNIQHAAILQQDALAQTVLLVVGCLNRLKSKSVKNLSRSSSYLHAVSNRLAASVPRARFLGMIVGVAVSRLVDEPDKAMKFDIEEMESEDAKRWLKLTTTEDIIGTLEDLAHDRTMSRGNKALTDRDDRLKHAPAHPRKPLTTSKIISIEEIHEDSDEDDDLAPHQKPDEDPSDSDDDPTLINRAKTSAPVYILDLIRYLQTSDKPDVVKVALLTAPTLIRRKAKFGTELSENMQELASALINLQEGMSSSWGHQQRLESLVACLVALPEKLGPWISSMYFEGDFSLAQRASLLTTIGLGTREIAGYKDDPKLTSDGVDFPSEQLPTHLEQLYQPLDVVARQIEQATLQPMALAAADKATGPDILKVRTFSSRMEVEKKTAQKSKERRVRIPKNLHQLLTNSFYLPLCGRMSLFLSALAHTRHSTLFEPHIMKLFLQTLTVLMTNLGPHALQLPTVTRETLGLLMALHAVTSIALDPVVLPSMLQLFLTTLDLNVEAGTVAEERLVSEFGSSVAELIAWAVNLNDVISVPKEDGSEGIPWTILASACQVKWHEVGRKYQGRMMGLIGSDFDSF